MSFATWRQQARLLESLRRLAAGEPVTKVALDCGYASASAFGAMFRRCARRRAERRISRRTSVAAPRSAPRTPARSSLPVPVRHRDYP